VLIDQLPVEASLNTAIRNSMPEDRILENSGDPVKARWSAMEGLTATLIDEVRNLIWIYQSAHTEQAIPRPEPIKRPGVTGRTRKLRQISLSDARKMDPRLRLVRDEDAQDALDEITGRTD
jgi:hypothetical protein